MSSSAKPPRQATGPSWRARRLIGLTALLIGLAILVYPLAPGLWYTVHRPIPSLPYHTRLTTDSGALASLPKLPTIADRPVPTDNRLVIPRIGVNMPILEGPDERVLDRGGVWHMPNSSTPDSNGNIVLSGHRWKYLPPSAMTLYLLDKVPDGDPVIIYWQGHEYDYTISGREVVPPTNTEILQPTDGPRLTIYTCTPLFSTKYRLVLYGQLIP